jgi:uncharacterized protein HemX
MQKDVMISKIQESEEKSKVALIVAVMTFVLVVVMFFWVRNETLKRVEHLEKQVSSIATTMEQLANEMRGKYALVQTRMNVLETTQKQQGERLAKVEDKIKRYSDAEAKRLKNEILGELETLKVLGVDKAKIETIKKLLQK